MRYFAIVIERPSFLNIEMISFLILSSNGPLLMQGQSLYIDQSFLSLIMGTTFPADRYLLFRISRFHQSFPLLHQMMDF